MNKVIIISGPTATGKTKCAISVAEKFGAEVVNFDSLLFYKELSIGTAKPSSQEIKNIAHHMIDVASITSPLNAADFVKMSGPIIEEIHSRQKPVVLVGGSGFYLQALCEGMWNSPTISSEVAKRSDELYQLEGIQPFRAILNEHDRESFLRLHENDHYRIRRAVEHFWAHGTPFSEAREHFTPQTPPNWNLLHTHLDLPKIDHFKIIEARTDKMLQDGLIDEVKSLLKVGFIGTEKPLQSIGYKETLDWIMGVYMNDFNSYRERISINTRRLAKAQRTWFKKKEKKTYDPRHEVDSLMADIQSFMLQE